MKARHLGSNSKKNSAKDLNKFEARFAKGKYKMKYKVYLRLQKC